MSVVRTCVIAERRRCGGGAVGVRGGMVHRKGECGLPRALSTIRTGTADARRGSSTGPGPDGPFPPVRNAGSRPRSAGPRTSARAGPAADGPARCPDAACGPGPPGGQRGAGGRCEVHRSGCATPFREREGPFLLDPANAGERPRRRRTTGLPSAVPRRAGAPRPVNTCAISRTVAENCRTPSASTGPAAPGAPAADTCRSRGVPGRTRSASSGTGVPRERAAAGATVVVRSPAPPRSEHARALDHLPAGRGLTCAP